MKELINRLSQYNTLTKEEAKAIFLRIGQGEFNNSELAAFMDALHDSPCDGGGISGFS